ncbi:MAG: B12-binding domain-containing radical SAM protein [Fibrobacter sp.]|nr:B12-binding domain-containing radical SAM protein [Fibrobacter sp.]
MHQEPGIYKNNAQITLYCIGRNYTCIGARRVAAYAKANGIRVRTIFIPDGFSGISSLDKSCLSSLLAAISDSTVHALSFFSNCLKTATALTSIIKQNFTAPVIWGGVHATAAPEDSLKYCDAVCLGEGEQAFVEYISAVANSKPVSGIQNIWLSTPDGIEKNIQRPLERNLDRLPFQDYDINDHLILINNRLRPLTLNDIKRNFGFTLTRMLTFGCPYRCTYCINDRYQALDISHAKMRRYSVDYFLKETLHILDRLPFIHYLAIDDDAFLSLDIDLIEEFCEKYKKEINLPFAIGGIRPETVSKDKLSLLIGAGLLTVRMGIQSGSERTQKEIFKRHFSRDNIIEAAKTLNSFKRKLRPPFYDIILDNPWENSDDKRKTLRLLRDLPHPFYLSAFSLTFFPGTRLYQKAREEGIIDEYKPRPDFQDIRKSYVNMMAYLLSTVKIPEKLFNKLVNSKRIEDENKGYALQYYFLLSLKLAHRLFSFYGNYRFIKAKIHNLLHRRA